MELMSFSARISVESCLERIESENSSLGVFRPYNLQYSSYNVVVNIYMYKL